MIQSEQLWLTAADMAGLGLPELPTRRESIIRLADRDGWGDMSGLSRPRRGRGGGLEYHIAVLPKTARLAYLRSLGEQVDDASAAVAAEPDSTAASASAAIARDARIAILATYRAFEASTGTGRCAGLEAFVRLYNSGRSDVPAWAVETVRALTARTLRRWLALREAGQTDRLAVDRGAARRGSGVLEAGGDGQVKAYILALHVRNPLYTARQIHDAVAEKFRGGVLVGDELRAIPALRAFETALKRWKSEHATELLALTNPDAFRSRRRVTGSYAHLISHLNEQWQIDASPVDALCLDGRYSIYVCIDVWSRRKLVYFTRTPRSEAVQMLLRTAILKWGKPKRVKTDNGSDFIARATIRLLDKLGIERETSVAFSPWQKGVVERSIRTFQTDFARTLPGFIGHSVADRKVIEARKAFAARLGCDDASAFAVSMTAEEMQAAATAWVETQYEHRPHGGIGGETPFKRAATSSVCIERVDPEQLAVLLMPAPDSRGLRTVGKSGVRIGEFHYMSPGLVVGDRVFVRLDPADKGRIWCFDPETEALLGEARCPELLGIDPAALRAEVAAVQKRTIDERNAEIRAAAKSITARTVLDARQAAANRAVGNIVAFPKPSESITTPALEAADLVVRQRRGDPPPTAPLGELEQRILAEIEAEAPPAVPANVRTLRREETPQQRYRRYRDLHERMEAHQPVSPDEAAFYGAYRNTSERKSMDTMFEEFGEAALR